MNCHEDTIDIAVLNFDGGMSPRLLRATGADRSSSIRHPDEQVVFTRLHGGYFKRNQCDVKSNAANWSGLAGIRFRA